MIRWHHKISILYPFDPWPRVRFTDHLTHDPGSDSLTIWPMTKGQIHWPWVQNNTYNQNMQAVLCQRNPSEVANIWNPAVGIAYMMVGGHYLKELVEWWRKSTGFAGHWKVGSLNAFLIFQLQGYLWRNYNDKIQLYLSAQIHMLEKDGLLMTVLPSLFLATEPCSSEHFLMGPDPNKTYSDTRSTCEAD